LQAVDVGLTVDLTGSVSVESLEAAPATISVVQTGNVSVASPTGSSLVAAAPEASVSAGFAAYDGVTDYAGASGTTFALANATTADATSSTGTMDLGPFLGTGTVALPVAATAALHVTGPANLQLLAHASAGAMVDLQYDYSGSGGANQGGGSSGVILTNGSVGLGLFGFANSVTTAAQTFSFVDRATGWSDSVAADRFDPTLGTLEAVNVVLSGGLSTGDAAKNEDTAAATVSVVQAATLNLALPGTAETTSASIATGMTLAGYDGAADFMRRLGRDRAPATVRASPAGAGRSHSIRTSPHGCGKPRAVRLWWCLALNLRRSGAGWPNGPRQAGDGRRPPRPVSRWGDILLQFGARDSMLGTAKLAQEPVVWLMTRTWTGWTGRSCGCSPLTPRCRSPTLPRRWV
jgi:hypothetical protein